MCLFLRVIKMVKVFKLGKIIASVEELIQSADIMLAWTIVKILGQVVLIAHWFACIYWLIGSTEQFYRIDGEISWPMKSSKNYISEAGIAEQYITSLYWAVQTMCTVGFGDYAPKTSLEQMFATFCMIVSAGVYSLSLENVDKIIRKHNRLAEHFHEHMLYVNSFMKMH
jgi:hypothetical protein